MKTVYITGCCGFLGSHLTNICLQKGWNVIGVDKMTYASRPENLVHWGKYYPNKFKFIMKDINDLDFLYECDYFINTCAESHVDNSIAKSEQFLHTNINGVYHILELIRNSHGQKPIFLQYSTDEVYGDIIRGKHSEISPLHPSNPYSSTKASADMLIMAWGRTYDIPYIIIRPTNNYGKYQYPEKLIPKTVKYLKLGKKIPLHNQGTPKRNWLHASDTSNAVITLIEAGVKNQIYNICGGFEQSNITTVRKIIQWYTGSKRNLNKYIDTSYSRVGQDVRYALDDSKLRALGWEPKINFDEEIGNIVEHYKEQEYIW